MVGLRDCQLSNLEVAAEVLGYWTRKSCRTLEAYYHICRPEGGLLSQSVSVKFEGCSCPEKGDDCWHENDDARGWRGERQVVEGLETGKLFFASRVEKRVKVCA